MDKIITVTKCPTCGCECDIGGDRTTHFYIPKQPRWIPVTERLPEPEQMVDVYTNRAEDARYCDVEYLPDLKFPWNQEDLCDDYATLGLKVTHWMPLPGHPQD